MLALVLAALMQSTAPADAPPEKPKPAAEARRDPKVETGVDANGVPAWAKRQKKQPVQSCAAKPNIGVETWREKYDEMGRDRLKPKPPTYTCH
jgi:hypothetical protein